MYLDWIEDPRLAIYCMTSTIEAKLPCGHRSRFDIYLVEYNREDQRQLNQCSHCGATWWLFDRGDRS